MTTAGEDKPRKRAAIGWIALAVVGLLFAAQSVLGPSFSTEKLAYSEFQAALVKGSVEEVTVSPTLIQGKLKASVPGLGKKATHSFEVVRVEDKDLLANLSRAGVKVSGAPEGGWWRDTMGMLLPLLLLGGFWVLLSRRNGAKGGLLAVGQSKAKIYMETDAGARFADVAGVDEAKEELEEVIEFLKTPEKFRRLGGRIPKGILLVGPPGTGKTLLARAVAGEASVPFFSISGSEFVEMFVGVGAARVRDLFNTAKARAPCIIFIDELDALGKARGVGPFQGAHEEREQTLNQLLVELDGFDARIGVILMAATNRPEILDPALLRAGRFDRQVVVDRPDRLGRLAILKVHARTITLAPDADLDAMAAMTAGLVGADLANLLNEAALLGVRRGLDRVGMAELQEAVERVIGGLEKKSRVLSRAERERVAHHEVGHALCAMATGRDPVRKISIIPRGVAALGYTLQLPTEDRFLMTQHELEDRIVVLLGGRVAEEVIYAEVSTGAQDDLVKATDVARAMVRSYGMSARLGPQNFERERRTPFDLPSSEGGRSQEVERAIDDEVRRILDEQHARSLQILSRSAELLHEVALVLLEHETLSGEELAKLVERSPSWRSVKQNAPRLAS